MHFICLLVSSDYSWWLIINSPPLSPLSCFYKSGFFPAVLLQKLMVLSQVKHQHWTDGVAWPGINSYTVCAPLLFPFSRFFLISWILQEVTGNFWYLTEGYPTVLGGVLPFRRTGYLHKLSIAICMKTQWTKDFCKELDAFLVFKSQNKIAWVLTSLVRHKPWGKVFKRDIISWACSL